MSLFEMYVSPFLIAAAPIASRSPRYGDRRAGVSDGQGRCRI